MNSDRDKKILELEAEWKIYHRDPRNNKMPDMFLLTKLRGEKHREEKNDTKR